MIARSLIAVLVSGVMLAGCAGGGGGGLGGLVSRNSVDDMPLINGMTGAHAPVPLNPSYRVTEIEVTVPRELTVSEANGIKPKADILWQEEAIGDRYAQVDAIVTEAVEQGVAGLNGARAVKLELVMTRFHALTKRTRYTYGGEHEVWMAMAVRDAATGELLEPARVIGFDLRIGADEALANEAQGIFQRDEIISAVKDMIRYELTRPRDFLQA
jgi:Family of unknown function (DUF6778)